MARTISKEFRITVGTAKDRLKVNKANAKQSSVGFEVSLEATNKAKGRAMNLIAFVESKTTLGEARKRAKAGTQSQVYFQVKRSGGKKMIKGAFIANKGRTLFIRTGKARRLSLAATSGKLSRMVMTVIAFLSLASVAQAGHHQ